MESRLKERLTGAAILVVVIVLLVPEIFRGQRGQESALTAASSGGEGAPLRSYTIDLSNNPKGGAPLQSSGEGNVAAGSDAARQNAAPDGSSGRDSTAAEIAKDSATREGMPPAASPPAIPSPSAPTAASNQASAPPAAARASAPRNPTREAARAHDAAPTREAAAPSTKGASSGAWSVQLGLFARRENAERVMGDAHNKGFSAGISTDAKGQFRVRATGLADRASADSLAQRLKSSGFSAAVVAPR